MRTAVLVPFGKTRADYLEQIVRDNTLPSITRDEEQVLPSNTWGADSLSPCIIPNNEHPQTSTALLPQLEALEALRDRLTVGTEVRLSCHWIQNGT